MNTRRVRTHQRNRPVTLLTHLHTAAQEKQPSRTRAHGSWPRSARDGGGADGEQWGAPNGAERRKTALTCSDRLGLATSSATVDDANDHVLPVCSPRNAHNANARYRCA